MSSHIQVVSVLDRLWLAKAMGYSAVLSCVSSCGIFMPSLACSSPSPKPTSDAFISKYSSSISL